MRRKSLAVDVVGAIGLLIVVLGVVNCVAAPMMMSTPLSLIMPEDAHVMLYFMLATGVATIFAGTLILFATTAMRDTELWAWSLAWRVTFFLLILGGGAVYVQLSNPFAHVLLVLVLALFITLPRSRVVLKTDPNQEWPK
jgi:hypothetical protein